MDSDGDGIAAPMSSAIETFTVPATSPLVIAMNDASASATLRVRLLSIAQQRHASTTATDAMPDPRST